MAKRKYYWVALHSDPMEIWHLKRKGDTHALCGVELNRCYDGALNSQDQCGACRNMVMAGKIMTYPGQVRDEPGFDHGGED